MSVQTNNPIHETLQRVFGFAGFRAHQREIVEALHTGRDVFAVMPTGAGKSLCYQLPALLTEGTAVVVSPLIALMKDQVDAARRNGIRADYVNSTLEPEERRAVAQRYQQGALDLLYLAPERLLMEGFLERLRACPLGQPAFFAIDEAHCISEWGHDFRKDYLGLDQLRASFPETPIAAFTATATEKVGGDIERRLQLRDPFAVRASFNRPNLYYEVRPKKRVRQQVADFVAKRRGQSGIVYRATRKEVEATAEELATQGIACTAYHAGLPDERRAQAQEAFLRGEAEVVVATIAFGMGIDKPDVRFVVHGDLPKNLESYYQETGRAGRDGDPAHCTLFYGRQDAMMQTRFLDEIEEEEERDAARKRLRAMERFAQSTSCRRKALLSYFDEELQGECTGCDCCSGDYEEIDATRDAQIVLSAIARTGQRFGGGHVTDIVIGKETPKVRDFGHADLKTFGMGRDRPKGFWLQVIESLLSAGRLETGGMRGAILQLNEGSWDLLKDRQTFSRKVRKDQEDSSFVKKRSRNAGGEVETKNPELFERLRAWRREQALAEDVPPYVIASDRMFREVCGELPQGLKVLRDLSGFGDRKVTLYGEQIIALVREFVATQATSEEATGSSRGTVLGRE
ncbi:MAG: DNA helicase RecQ [Verrucomicrobiota bacterium]